MHISVGVAEFTIYLIISPQISKFICPDNLTNTELVQETRVNTYTNLIFEKATF